MDLHKYIYIHCRRKICEAKEIDLDLFNLTLCVRRLGSLVCTDDNKSNFGEGSVMTHL